MEDKNNEREYVNLAFYCFNTKKIFNLSNMVELFTGEYSFCMYDFMYTFYAKHLL